MRTSSARRLKRLYPASRIFVRRSSSVVSLSGSTEWMRNGSMIVLYCGGTAAAYERIIEVHAARSPSGLGRFPFKEEVMGSNPIRATHHEFVRLGFFSDAFGMFL